MLLFGFGVNFGHRKKRTRYKSIVFKVEIGFIVAFANTVIQKFIFVGLIAFHNVIQCDKNRFFGSNRFPHILTMFYPSRKSREGAWDGAEEQPVMLDEEKQIIPKSEVRPSPRHIGIQKIAEIEGVVMEGRFSFFCFLKKKPAIAVGSQCGISIRFSPTFDKRGIERKRLKFLFRKTFWFYNQIYHHGTLHVSQQLHNVGEGIMRSIPVDSGRPIYCFLGNFVCSKISEKTSGHIFYNAIGFANPFSRSKVQTTDESVPVIEPHNSFLFFYLNHFSTSIISLTMGLAEMTSSRVLL